MNRLFYGDNLDVLREHIQDESVDLIYLDPPFNSKQAYNLLFQPPKGRASQAQILAFEDTWHWGEQAEREYEEIVRSSNTDAAEMMRAMRRFLGENDMMAYLTMMANRLLELHRVLKSSGSVYLHCDPTASHYLKLVLDSVFGKENFRNEVVWKRTPFAGSSKARAQQYPRSHDILLFYSKSDEWTWKRPTKPYSEKYLARFKWDDRDGRGPYRKTLLKTYSKETFERLKAENRLIPPQQEGAKWSYKQYLSESSGEIQIDDVWSDINAINPAAKERLGYPTQKPLALLERIVLASSNEGGVVLDPFCGCGSAVHAAHKHNREWIGIDITHLAIALIEKRLRDAFPSIEFEVEGTPKDVEGAYGLAKRDKYQFQWWACSLVHAQPYRGKRKGADKGIDGLIFFTDVVNARPFTQKIIVSVKGGEHVGVSMIRELATVVEQNDAQIGLFITLNQPTQPMVTEATKAGFYRAGNGRDYPRVQILTIEDLLTGRKRPEYLDFSQGAETFKRAQVEKPTNNQDRLL